MKVSELKEIINTLGIKDDDEVCVILYHKSAFNYGEDDDLVLTDSAWGEVVKSFEEQPFYDLYESVSMACAEFAEMKEL
jgi:hypothetical protein